MQVIISTENIEEPPVETDDVRTILVRDKHGNPIFLAMQQNDDNIWAVTPGDPKFNELIEQLGISKRLTIKQATVGG
jgi:ssDNA-specific exonuclease RecJ